MTAIQDFTSNSDKEGRKNYHGHKNVKPRPHRILLYWD